MNKDLKFQAIAIGSLPHKDSQKAMSIVKENFSIPFFPQLANVQKAEDMIIQFLEGFPTFNLTNENLSLDTESESFYSELEGFFADYEEIISDTNSDKLNKYGISEKCSSTFQKFLDLIKETKPKYAKGQIVGAFTLSAALTDIDGKNLVFDETLRDIVVKLLSLKALWQINQIKKANPSTTPIIFMDEPTISQLGTSAYLTISDDNVYSMLKEISDLIHDNNAISAIHCCGKCDWNIPIKAGIDILNFDAYAYSKHLSLYSNSIKDFLQNGGKIAWGLVPTLDSQALSTITIEDLLEKFDNSLKYLTNNQIDEKLITENSLITSSCGAGSLTEDLAEHAMYLVKELSHRLRERF